MLIYILKFYGFEQWRLVFHLLARLYSVISVT